jgi:hypothetical protein
LRCTRAYGAATRRAAPRRAAATAAASAPAPRSRVDLPLWLATHLAEKQFVAVELPRHFRCALAQPRGRAARALCVLRRAP